MSTADSRRRLVILMYPHVREMDIACVNDLFSTANSLLPPERQYEIVRVSTVKSGGVDGMFGIGLSGGPLYSSLRGKIDTIIVPGGMGNDLSTPPVNLIRWLRKQGASARRVGSICTGAWLLAHAGLLDGRRATTHWNWARRLAADFPAVDVDPAPIWVKDGNIYTSAGATSGIDLSLALVEEDHGRAIALEVARQLVVFLCRPGNQAQFSTSLMSQSLESTPLRDLQYWMLDNLRGDLSVPALAARVNMSERNFQRVFTREVGKAPAHFVEEIRVEAARRKLERSTQSLGEISAACGFGSADVMSRSFQRRLETSPGEYRSRFRSSGIGATAR